MDSLMPNLKTVAESRYSVGRVKVRCAALLLAIRRIFEREELFKICKEFQLHMARHPFALIYSRVAVSAKRRREGFDSLQERAKLDTESIRRAVS